MRIGIDFDNTLVCYDQLFWTMARNRDLIDPSVPVRKDAVRNDLRQRGLEPEWTKLQGEAYGSRILEAAPFPGVARAFEEFQRRNWTVFVISHKTRTPFAGDPHDLHAAARGWLTSCNLVNSHQSDLTLDRVYFELTKRNKLQRIAELKCDVFIDDLPELLLDAEFPADVQRVLFDPHRQFDASPAFRTFYHWSEVIPVLNPEAGP